MTISGPGAVYRYVSDGSMAAAMNRDAIARAKGLIIWPVIILFVCGFGGYILDNREYVSNYLDEVLRNAVVLGSYLAAIPFIGGIIGLSLAMALNRRRMNRLFPLGSVTIVELTVDALVLSRPTVTRSIPYQKIRRVRAKRNLQWIMVGGRPAYEILPAGLLSSSTIEFMEARSRGVMPIASSPTPVGRTCEVDVPAGWATHVAFLHVQTTVLKPKFWLRTGLVILVSAPVALISVYAWLLIGPTLAIVAVALTFTMTRRAVASALPTGSVASVEFQQDALISRNALGVRRIPRASIGSVQVRGDVVFLQLISGPPKLSIARALFSDEEFVRLVDLNSLSA